MPLKTNNQPTNQHISDKIDDSSQEAFDYISKNIYRVG